MEGSQQAGRASRMAAAAVAFLASLDPDQRRAATAPFDTPDHREWTYLPGPRPGLALADMTERQRELAMVLLDTGLSAHGSREARAVMALEAVLRELERGAGRAMWRQRHPHYYWVRILGDPGGDQPWAWRVNGHHLATHVTVVGDRIAATPQFFGANPARVPSGPHAGLRTLPDAEDLGRALLEALDPDRRTVAIVSPEAPDDILTRRDPVADPSVVPRGLTYADMTEPQRRLLTTLVRYYMGRVAPEAAETAWRDAVDAGLTEVAFCWAGSTTPGEGHYYAVTGPTFLLEYDNTQNGANHVHTVWRDLRRDWGEDLLAAHYAAHHA
ncbi:DUF3500 domain-containing protein [Thermasporomyces composti]|jgi:hypothetical protein|uniref:Uncharacterized protein DUF3500 n=1 Tax=Thermasporomyces composti TaxID=696763 RepID=A0A3D9V074_THECX|nr:DUF3500 domain-containing protein [Thermasporomyces composti]REF34879.1 uncharacterized protein DUF3500 [Thermasporomyces composti]